MKINAVLIHRNIMMLKKIFLFIFFLSVSGLAAGPFTVNTTSDTHDANPGNGVAADASDFCSLRAAIEEANAQVSATTINIPAGTYNLTLGELSVAPDGNRTITIVGAGAAITIINQTDGTNRVFNLDLNIAGGVNVTISGVTIQGGHDNADEFGGGGIIAGTGIAFPRDVLTLSNCIVTSNVSGASVGSTNRCGGGVEVAGGDLTVTNCTFSSNTTNDDQGGAIWYKAFGSSDVLSISGSTFSNNSVNNATTLSTITGGAIYISGNGSGTYSIANSNFTDNSVVGTSTGSANGGAICFVNSGTLNVTGSTFANNSATGTGGGAGGAFYIQDATANITSCRIVGNTATTGGSAVYRLSGTVTAQNNWWGCNYGPGTGGAGCSGTPNAISGTVTYDPWLVLSLSASPSTINVGDDATLTADVTHNSSSGSGFSILNGTTVTFAGDACGTADPSSAATSSGTASSVYTGTTAGSGAASAVLDGQTATTNITVDSPVPVELVSFTAAAKRLTAELRWKTATEVNNYGFEVEKKAVGRWPLANSQKPNDNSWSKVGFVEGNGTANSPREYSFIDKDLNAGKYSYRLKQIDRDGGFKYYPTIEVEIGTALKVFELSGNHPNPFNPATTIEFTIPDDGFVTLRVYDMLGREAAILVNQELKAGIIHRAVFDAASLSSGMYIARLQFKDQVRAGRMLLMK